jgi:hypothetical protein
LYFEIIRRFLNCGGTNHEEHNSPRAEGFKERQLVSDDTSGIGDTFCGDAGVWGGGGANGGGGDNGASQ